MGFSGSAAGRFLILPACKSTGEFLKLPFEWRPVKAALSHNPSEALVSTSGVENNCGRCFNLTQSKQTWSTLWGYFWDFWTSCSCPSLMVDTLSTYRIFNWGLDEINCSPPQRNAKQEKVRQSRVVPDLDRFEINK